MVKSKRVQVNKPAPVVTENRGVAPEAVRGTNKSGKKWKVPQKTKQVTSRSKHCVKGSFKSSFEERKARKQQIEEDDARQERLNSEKRELATQRRKEIEATRERRRINELRSATYQVITDTSKIKRMNRRQRQSIKKIDTSFLHKGRYVPPPQQPDEDDTSSSGRAAA